MGRLFWKILLTFWLTLLVAGGVAGIAVWQHQRVLHAVSEDLVIRPASVLAVKAAASTYRFGGVEALRDMLEEQRREAPRSLRVYAVDDAGRELLGRETSNDTLQRVRQSVADDVRPPIARSEQNAGQSYLFFVPKLGQLPDYREKNRLPPHFFSGWMMIVTGVLASFISSFLLAWYFSRPIRSLRGAFGSLAAGDLGKRVAPSIGRRRDELADLGQDFDNMAARLQGLMSSQRRLLHDVSHELRSPLARLQVSIGLARQQPERMATCLDRIEREAERLDKLVSEVLTLSRLESGVAQSMDEYIDVLELLDNVIDDARFEADALSRQVVFQCDVERSPIIQGRGELLYRALENVVRNAIHHTPKNTQVTLAVHEEPSSSLLHIIVDDQGPGVPEKELGSIFEAFQRGGAPAHEGYGSGYGLGLAIARRAIEHHGGSIRAVNRPQGGLRVEIILPSTARA